MSFFRDYGTGFLFIMFLDIGLIEYVLNADEIVLVSRSGLYGM